MTGELISLFDQPHRHRPRSGARAATTTGRLARAARPGRLPRTTRPDRDQDRAAHRGRPDRDPHPAAGLLRRADRPRRVLPSRGHTAPSQRVRRARRRQREGPQGQLVRSRRPPAQPCRPGVHRTTDDRPVQRRGTDLGGPRPAGRGPWRCRQAAARDRARVRDRAEVHRPRALDTVTHAALRLGRTTARAADPHRARARHRGAHLDHRAHHPDRAAPSHHHRRDRQRVPEPVHLRGRPAGPAATRRRRPRPAQRNRPGPLPHQRAQDTPTPPAKSRSPPTRGSCGGTPTRSSPSPPTVSTASSPPAPKRT